MFTSCCPAWVKYLELNDPKYLRNISSCKSPMEMFAAVLRDKYQAKDAADGRRTYHMAIMPCTAKKMEAARAEFTQEGRPDVDLVITTRELVDMIREAGIQLTELEPEAPDLPFGLGSGAAVIYGVTGGVAEAVVRYCLPDKSNNALQAIRVTDLRGDGAIREVNLTVEGQELHIAIVRPVPRQGADRRRGGRKAVLSPGRGHDLPGRLRRRRGPALWPDGGEEAPRRGSVRGGRHRHVQGSGEEPHCHPPAGRVRP